MLEIQYEEKTIQNAFFCLGKKVYFWDSIVNIRIHLPKFFLPEIKRQILALIKTERKIFWDPWKKWNFEGTKYGKNVDFASS